MAIVSMSITAEDKKKNNMNLLSKVKKFVNRKLICVFNLESTSSEVRDLSKEYYINYAKYYENQSEKEL